MILAFLKMKRSYGLTVKWKKLHNFRCQMLKDDDSVITGLIFQTLKAVRDNSAHTRLVEPTVFHCEQLLLCRHCIMI